MHPVSEKGVKTPAWASSAQASGAGLGVSPALQSLLARIEDALIDLADAEFARMQGKSRREDVEEILERIKEAEETARKLLNAVNSGVRGRKGVRGVKRIHAYLVEAERRIKKILAGRGRNSDWGLALDFIRAAWVDAQEIIGNTGAQIEAVEGAEDLVIPSPREVELPEAEEVEREYE
ncbi:MAG: hypothetical protein LM590_14835 [Thermofilum sp.]|nr:hypothetical protein [Thermofilum sp.]